MRMLSGAVLPVMILVPLGCKTTDRSLTQAAAGVAGASVSGAFDANNSVLLSMPPDLVGAPPGATAPSRLIRPGGGGDIKGLGLADSGFQGSRAPRDTGLGPGIIVTCYSRDDRFRGEDWFFYAELYEDGKLVSQGREALNSCSEIQLRLVRLNSRHQYKIKAAIFYEFESTKDEIIYYQTEEDPTAFSPDEENKTIVLQKVIAEETVSVELQDTRQETCRNRGYVWDGSTCLDTPHRVMFRFSSKNVRKNNVSSFGSALCIEAEAGARAETGECSFTNPNQAFMLHRQYEDDTRVGNDEVGADSAGYREVETTIFSIVRADQANNECLQVVKIQSQHLLALKPCDDKAPGQMFAIMKTTLADQEGAFTFRIRSITGPSASGSAPEFFCITAPLAKVGSSVGKSDFRPGHPIAIKGCGTASDDEKAGMDIEFSNRGEFVVE